eukprot:g3745.t1
MKVLAIFAVIVLAAGNELLAAGNEHRAAFDAFKQRFGKSYASAQEEAQRFSIFADNAQQIAAAGDSGTLGVTKFSDLTAAEFSARYLGLRRPHPDDRQRRFWDGTCYACRRFPEHGAWPAAAAADGFDWTTKGAVTGIKTQNCGDCYAFGSTGDIEGASFVAGNPLTPLSEEQIIDCCYEDQGLLQCAGCAGGEPHSVFDWLLEKEGGGICSESGYPYIVPKKQPHPAECQRAVLTNASFAGGARIRGWYWVSQSAKGEANMTAQLPKVGPMVLGIDATGANMQQYKGGIAKPSCEKDPTLNHAVLVVGYGTEDGVDYWKIKNQWGEDWGEDGYYRIVRGSNACGLANDVVHSFV